jgi:hypothetical protein
VITVGENICPAQNMPKSEYYDLVNNMKKDTNTNGPQVYYQEYIGAVSIV